MEIFKSLDKLLFLVRYWIFFLSPKITFRQSYNLFLSLAVKGRKIKIVLEVPQTKLNYY